MAGIYDVQQICVRIIACWTSVKRLLPKQITALIFGACERESKETSIYCQFTILIIKAG